MNEENEEKGGWGNETHKLVIIISYSNEINPLTESIFKDIASRSFGYYIPFLFQFSQMLLDSMDLLLVTPLNCYERILEVTVNAPEYVQEFNITGYDYLLITSLGNLNVSLTDPNGWDNSGNCSDVQCHLNATCENYVGYKQQCVCKEGFIGNGSNCFDIDECAGNSWWHATPYLYTSCVNSIGSFNASCYSGYIYEETNGCIDIDECASDYPNGCHPLAICINTDGSYFCYCSYGYFGDGKQCVENECLQSTTCNDSSTDCIKDLTSHTCTNPCFNYTTITSSPSGTTSTYYSLYSGPYKYGWYRFGGGALQIPEYCLPSGTCGSYTPIWMNGAHPTINDGIVSRTACVSTNNRCCMGYFSMPVKACPGGYYVYKLDGIFFYNYYCLKSNYSCPNMNCFPDEECRRNFNGIPQCQCSDAVYYNDGSAPNTPADLMSPECRLNQMKMTFRKCLLERMGYSSSSLHLRDGNCESVIERTDRSYVAISTVPVSGHCGTYQEVNQTHWTYTNVIYLSPKSSSANGIFNYTVNFSCSYVKNMETLLWLSADTFISKGNLTIGASTIYPIRMGFFEDSSYTVLYEVPTAWLNYSSLYVGISVENNGNSQVVLVIKNCSATVISGSGNSTSYDIMSNYCPSMSDSTLSILENGVSSQGRFQLQAFRKFGNFSTMYLHCQVHLCNTTIDSCYPSLNRSCRRRDTYHVEPDHTGLRNLHDAAQNCPIREDKRMRVAMEIIGEILPASCHIGEEKGEEEGAFPASLNFIGEEGFQSKGKHYGSGTMFAED
ncbi:uromodulin-like [Dendropsophus ebraccatus]|uniref:uromodulin-like n=1 Tax=Dendropsophus ebraccatus TaxID=150705 RepID=UPI003831898E